MKKSEAEKAIRSLCSKWEQTLESADKEHPSFYQFKDWLNANGYGGYLNFRSSISADYDAEIWFDQELGQAWRN